MAQSVNPSSANKLGGAHELAKCELAKLNWRNSDARNAAHRRGHVARAVAAAIILLAAPPAWPQNEGAGAPAPDNVLQTSSFNGTFSRWMRPPTAEAAPRNPQKQRVRAAKVRQAVGSGGSGARAAARGSGLAECAKPRPAPARSCRWW